MDPPEGVVAWWTGDGHPEDSIGENHGTPQNGATYAAGFIGQAFSFDGSDDYVLIPASDALGFESDDSWSIEAWVVWDDTFWPRHIAGKRQGCYGGPPPQQLCVGPAPQDLPPPSVPLDTWTHVAITFDSETGEITNYANGAQVNYLDGATPAAWNPEPWKIGNSGTCDPWSGLIDEIAIYGRALTPPEVAQLFDAGEYGKCTFSDGFESGDTSRWSATVS